MLFTSLSLLYSHLEFLKISVAENASVSYFNVYSYSRI